LALEKKKLLLSSESRTAKSFSHTVFHGQEDRV